MLVAVFTRLPCVETVLLLPPMFVAKFNRPPGAVTVLLSPKRLVAKFKIDPALVAAVELFPTTKAAPNSPSAWATAPSPMAMAALKNALVQSTLFPMPKKDAHVAFAVGANPNAAVAHRPLVTAPATRAPASLRGEFAALGAIICCSIQDMVTSTPLATVSRLARTGNQSAKFMQLECGGDRRRSLRDHDDPTTRNPSPRPPTHHASNGGARRTLAAARRIAPTSPPDSPRPAPRVRQPCRS